MRGMALLPANRSCGWCNREGEGFWFWKSCERLV